MRHFCTLFDQNYLTKGMVLYHSLAQHSSEPFTLFVLPMDAITAETLEELALPNVQIVRGFHEQPKMRPLRSSRSWPEYCWTCASNLCEFLLLGGLQDITYLDADLMFFSDPKVVFDEIGDRSIAVIPHRLIPSKRHLEVNGRFNVSWVTFAGPQGFWCAQRWAEQCRDRCSAEVGCGDQVYLDEWPGMFQSHLCIIQNIGAGLAPWNLANYWIGAFGSSTCVGTYPLPTGAAYPVVFYHYHEFMEREDGTFRLTNYDLRPEDIAFIYEPYLEAYQSAKIRIAATWPQPT